MFEHWSCFPEKKKKKKKGRHEKVSDVHGISTPGTTNAIVKGSRAKSLRSSTDNGSDLGFDLISRSRSDSIWVTFKEKIWRKNKLKEIQKREDDRFRRSSC